MQGSPVKPRVQGETRTTRQGVCEGRHRPFATICARLLAVTEE